MIYQKRNQCAICGNNNLKEVIKLGSVPLAGYFPKNNELENTDYFDLNLNFCEKCGLVQTDSIIDPDFLFKDYRYMSSIGLTKHFQNLANILNDKYNLKYKKILEIGSNDGVLLEPISKFGSDIIGIDPAINICEIAKSKGLNVICDYFNIETAKKYNFKDKFDIILSNNTFAHVINISSVLEGIKYSLKEGGLFILEVHYLDKLISEYQWDNIYHEHIYYYSIIALNNFAKLHGLKIIDFEDISNHSGSIRVTMLKGENKYNHNLNIEKVNDRIQLEKKNGLFSIEYFNEFSDKMNKQISQFKKLLKNINKPIIGYGASGRANIFCNILGLNKEIISFIIDESPERNGRNILPNIPIYDMDALNNIDKNTYILILAWNYKDMIIEKLQKNGFNNYIVAFPEPKVVI